MFKTPIASGTRNLRIAAVFCGLLFATMLLTACKEVVRNFDPAVGYRDMNQDTDRFSEEDPVPVQTADTQPSPSPSTAISSSFAFAGAFGSPQIIDLPIVFQEEFAQQQPGLALKNAVTAEGSDVEFLKINGVMRRHFNPTRNHYLYVISGRGELELGIDVSEIRAGHLIVIPAGTVHRIASLGAQPINIMQITVPGQADGDEIWQE